MFGYQSSNTSFNTLGKTGGENLIQLTAANMPIHTHSFTVTYTKTDYITDEYENGWHNHKMRYDNNDSTKKYGDLGSSRVEYFDPEPGPTRCYEVIEDYGWHTHTYSGQVKGTIEPVGSGGGVNILKPYIVVYMWKKTA